MIVAFKTFNLIYFFFIAVLKSACLCDRRFRWWWEREGAGMEYNL